MKIQLNEFYQFVISIGVMQSTIFFRHRPLKSQFIDKII